jgi:hypothetical protein
MTTDLAGSIHSLTAKLCETLKPKPILQQYFQFTASQSLKPTLSSPLQQTHPPCQINAVNRSICKSCEKIVHLLENQNTGFRYMTPVYKKIQRIDLEI